MLAVKDQTRGPVVASPELGTSKVGMQQVRQCQPKLQQGEPKLKKIHNADNVFKFTIDLQSGAVVTVCQRR